MMTDTEILQSLVPEGTEINAVDRFGSTVLLQEILFDGNFDHVRVLVEAGADINFVDKFGDTAWNIARRIGHQKIADWLLQHGAHEPAGIEDDIFQAVLWNKMDAVRRLAKSGIDLNTVNAFGVTPLVWAITQEASSEILSDLIESGADVNRRSGNSYYENSSSTPLIHAIECGNIKAVKPLLEAGADVNAIVEPGNVMNAPYRMAIFGAAYASQPELLNLLIGYGADVNVRDCMGFTPLIVTVREWPSYSGSDPDTILPQDGNLEVTRMLLDAGADIDATLPPDFDEYGRRDHFNMPPVGDHFTALQLAIAKRNTAGAMLLRERGANVYPDSTAWSWLLGISVSENNLLLVQTILDSGISPNLTDPEDGMTALHIACRKGHLPIVKLLLERGADVNAQTHATEHRPGTEGWTPLMFSVHTRLFCYVSDDPNYAVNYERSKFESVKLILEYGADVGIQNTNGEMALNLINAYWNPENRGIAYFNEARVVLATARLFLQNMNDFITLQFSLNDFDAATSHRLLDWCSAHGADEWTITALRVEGSSLETFTAFEAAMEPFRKPNAFREAMSSQVGENLVQLTELWELTPESFAALARIFPKGIFEYQVTPDGWFEDFGVYRNGLLMLGIVSHEGIGILRVTPEERNGLSFSI